MPLTNMITAVDLHACGEPGRVITGGVLDSSAACIALAEDNNAAPKAIGLRMAQLLLRSFFMVITLYQYAFGMEHRASSN